MSEYNALARMRQGGAELEIASGGRITILSGGILDIKTGGIVQTNGTQAAVITDLTNSAGGSANDTIAAITALTSATLTDSSGGTPATTIAAIGGTYNQAEVRNAIASLAAQVNALRVDITNSRTAVADVAAEATGKCNAIIAALKGLGLIASA